ncbi:MAG: tyrosine-type recombinase/integrase, partial [Clostridiales bacterium]|nr:tyrosine-type recombinase/integrase [Clostridiales bacterium]
KIKWNLLLHWNLLFQFSLKIHTKKQEKCLKPLPLLRLSPQKLKPFRQMPHVACTGVGTRNTARNLQRSLDRLVRNAEIEEHITLHILRHTFGSTLIRRGVGIEVVSKLMGHANITITYNKYIHVIQEEEAKAMNLTPI